MPDSGAEILEEMRQLPSVEALMEGASQLGPSDGRERPPRELLLAWARQALEEAREEIRRAAEEARNGGSRTQTPRGREAWSALLLARLGQHLESRSQGKLRHVVNATGVLLHTNLGRAPLPARAQAALGEIAAGYSSLELDLASGRRQSRLESIRRLLPLVTGAEAGFAVHNNAASIYLALVALASGREVVVSRGHLVEIGGGFRLPDIMAASGARLVEVGTTNRTRLEDYARALRPETALLLKVHPSNFRIVGYTEDVPTRDLARLAAERSLPLLEDLGSGALEQHGSLALDEPRVQDSLKAGADLVAFSGDKLLGGPQAGILVGRRTLIERLSKHPVARVVRLEKATLAALEATLEGYLDPASSKMQIPLLGLLARTEVELETRAQALALHLGEALGPRWQVEVVASASEVGGGSLPGLSLPSRAVSLAHPSIGPDGIGKAFRLATPAVAGRIEKDRFLLDLRSVLDGEEAEIVRAALVLKPLGEQTA